MKNIVKISACTLLAGGLLFTTACSEDFLKEVRNDKASSSLLETPEGLASLANGLYSEFGYFFSNESSYCYTNYGTDEFMVAGDASNSMWNDYNSSLKPEIPAANSNTQMANTYWNELYSWIARCNTVIDNADVLEGSSLKDEALGIAYFVRGFNHLFLTMQYGDIPLITDAITSPQREFTRNSSEDVYNQIISDLEQAYGLLTSDATQATKNYLTKYAAAHYLAQAHLWRASEINESWNKSYIAQDLADCIKYADEVIAAHPLAADYNDLFNNFTAYDTSITETNTEIVLSSGNSDASTTTRKINYALCTFTAWYSGFPLMVRDVAGAREYQRLKTCPNYAYYIYDLKNDSRFWKSFKTTYAVNSNTKVPTIQVNGEDWDPAVYFPSNDGEYLSTMYIINRKDYGQKYYSDEVNTVTAPVTTALTSLVDYHTGKNIPAISTLVIYDKETGAESGTALTPDYNTLYAPVCKYLDGAVNVNNMSYGYRDGLLARSAEDYFFKAEALIRQGNIDAGLAVLKPLRDRAQYKPGEERDAYVDGGYAYQFSSYKPTLAGYTDKCAFYPWNSYYYSLGGYDDEAYREATNAEGSVLQTVTSSSYPAEDMYVINKLGYTDPQDMAMCYLLNEKSREMYGEYKRWMDLARTKTLEDRLVFNEQAVVNFNPAMHYYRPIPQDFLDNITKDGVPLTADEKKAMQNPGYAALQD